jgi:hypothetical protein
VTDEDVQEELQADYYRLVSSAYTAGKISQSWYENLIDRYGNDLDEIEQASRDFQHALKNGEYYVTLDRITRGEEMLEAATDEAQKAEYRKLLHTLTLKLEHLTPKEESA